MRCFCDKLMYLTKTDRSPLENKSKFAVDNIFLPTVSLLVVLHEANRTGGFGGEICALAAEEAFHDLKAPVKRVAPPPIFRSLQPADGAALPSQRRTTDTGC